MMEQWAALLAALAKGGASHPAAAARIAPRYQSRAEPDGILPQEPFSVCAIP
jgi:hypothetical protein